MSKEQFDAFFAKVVDDEDLRTKMAKVGDEPDKADEIIAGIAADAGYDVSVADVAAAGITIRETEDISDTELERVAGGCSSQCAECCGMHLGAWVGQQ